eukprot:scaffold876_cov92-Skeletonema_dohrnii-CCMP3373.AAC.8
MMSEDKIEADILCCASCGVAAGDEVKLKNCTACYLVKYCSIKCQKEHRPQHKRACKKRAAELRVQQLFKQPESSHLGDCPICMMPMPLDLEKSSTTTCCSKRICDGCDVETQKRELEERRDQKCPFCREPVGNELWRKQILKRIEANDPVAMCREGVKQYDKGDYSSAFGYFTRAAELGDVDAHSKLSLMYHYGQGVEKDKGKEMHHLEEAAIGGHPGARYNLAGGEWHNGNTERAVKHWIIAASQGHDESIKPLMDAFKSGMVSKEVLSAALRAHQAAVDATKSPQRAAAEEYSYD